MQTPGPGVPYLDCHANGHTNGACHLKPDNQPHIVGFARDTVECFNLILGLQLTAQEKQALVARMRQLSSSLLKCSILDARHMPGGALTHRQQSLLPRI